MEQSTVTIVVERGIATVTLNRPHARNAISTAMAGELARALDRLDEDGAVKVLLLTGVGGHFAAGADVKEMLLMTLSHALATDFSGCCPRLGTVRKPVIAAIDGFALGGGMELVEMCDVVVASTRARFAHPEVTLGTMSGAGGTQRLARLTGRHIAMDLLLTGRVIRAEEAHRLGIVSRVVAPEKLMGEARAIARQIASLSFPVVQMIKQSVNRAFEGPLSDGLALEHRLFQLTFALDDRLEGMTAFAEKRPPHFQDR
ncbi:enoyl-CoA hydratase-related protein [Acidiferrobacter sp.]|uniref:enoyl-CoA hydratase-related protein n=1 Tax=Acidiferrobacter sp. TaxID=1872107 RepID=UPI002633D2C8|nr:enoyl-CoA hydratase-related protein [Acidiferrobacter sp.]MCL5044869.1 enoyl-CoA hydratase-related protein [Deltaproteobacteria bacterium]